MTVFQFSEEWLMPYAAKMVDVFVHNPESIAYMEAQADAITRIEKVLEGSDSMPDFITVTGVSDPFPFIRSSRIEVGYTGTLLASFSTKDGITYEISLSDHLQAIEESKKPLPRTFRDRALKMRRTA